MNYFFEGKLLRQIYFWREKRLKDEIRTSFNTELYLRVLEARNK